jgi:ABC-type lipoprotein release transport system permease subunit
MTSERKHRGELLQGTLDLIVLRPWLKAGGQGVRVLWAHSGARLSAFRYAVSPHDVLTFIAGPLVVALIGMVACSVPAHRAAKVNPLIAIRCG